MAQIKNLTSANFSEETKSGVVLVDFWAPWCSSCKMLGTILDKVAAETSPEIVIGKVNVDDNKELAVQMEVINLPRMFLFKDGQVVKEFNGVQSKSKLIEALTNC